MTGPLNERPSGRRIFRILVAVFAATALAGGVSAVVLESATTPAAAALIPVNQCNGILNTAGTTTTCNVTVENFLTDDPLTTHSIVTTFVNGATTVTPSSDIVNSVTQCNGVGNGGGSTVHCMVSIINHIEMTEPGAVTAATVNQCQANQANDGLGMDLVNTCSPTPGNAATSGATITQCNGTGNGGGLVNAGIFSHCTASGSVSSALSVTVNQCNGSVNGGDAFVLCTASITTEVVDTSVTDTPTGGTGGSGGSSDTTGFPVGPITPIPGVPKTAG